MVCVRRSVPRRMTVLGGEGGAGEGGDGVEVAEGGEADVGGGLAVVGAGVEEEVDGAGRGAI